MSETGVFVEADANTLAISNLVAAISSTMLLTDPTGGHLKIFLSIFEKMNSASLPGGPVAEAMTTCVGVQRALLAQLGR